MYYLGDTGDGTSDELVDEGEGLGFLRHDGSCVCDCKCCASVQY